MDTLVINIQWQFFIGIIISTAGSLITFAWYTSARFTKVETLIERMFRDLGDTKSDVKEIRDEIVDIRSDIKDARYDFKREIDGVKIDIRNIEKKMGIV